MSFKNTVANILNALKRSIIYLLFCFLVKIMPIHKIDPSVFESTIIHGVYKFVINLKINKYLEAPYYDLIKTHLKVKKILNYASSFNFKTHRNRSKQFKYTNLTLLSSLTKSLICLLNFNWVSVCN